MNVKTYLTISGIIFAIVAIAHFVRIMKHASVMFGSWSAPMAVSWIGLIIAGSLSLWAFKLMCCKDRREY